SRAPVPALSCRFRRTGPPRFASRYRFAVPPRPDALADRSDDVAGHRAQLPAPRTPVVAAATREVEVSVVSADVAVLLVEEPGVTHRLAGLTDHGRGVAAHAHRAPDPDPRVVSRQQRRVHVRVVPFPPA